MNANCKQTLREKASAIVGKELDALTLERLQDLFSGAEKTREDGHPRAAAAQAAFVTHLRSHGIMRTLEWVDEWYERAARGHIEDLLVIRLGEAGAKDPEARELELTEMALRSASQLSHRSSSAGTELMKDKMAHVASDLLRGYHTLRKDRESRWASVQARLEAATS